MNGIQNVFIVFSKVDKIYKELLQTVEKQSIWYDTSDAQSDKGKTTSNIFHAVGVLTVAVGANWIEITYLELDSSLHTQGNGGGQMWSQAQGLTIGLSALFAVCVFVYCMCKCVCLHRVIASSGLHM